MRILRIGITLVSVAAVGVLGLGACSSSSSSSSSGGTTTDSGTKDTGASPGECGTVGDVGNSLGVGKYCKAIADCASNGKATTCSTLGNTGSDPTQYTYFCTFLCTNPDGGGADAGSECGENATCSCDNSGCGCTPNKCLN